MESTYDRKKTVCSMSISNFFSDSRECVSSFIFFSCMFVWFFCSLSLRTFYSKSHACSRSSNVIKNTEKNPSVNNIRIFVAYNCVDGIVLCAAHHTSPHTLLLQFPLRICSSSSCHTMCISHFLTSFNGYNVCLCCS